MADMNRMRFVRSVWFWLSLGLLVAISLAVPESRDVQVQPQRDEMSVLAEKLKWELGVARPVLLDDPVRGIA